MKLIQSSTTILPQDNGLEGIYKQIEIAGRTCYKSEDKITETSAKEFVNRMIKSGHGAMLEHGTIYLKINLPVVDTEDSVYLGNWLADFYYKNKYSKINYINNILYITTNLRVIIENNRLEELSPLLCEPTEYHEKRVAVKFICDRGVSHELVRHRVFSFAQESTRYCNYSKDKFGNELTFITPSKVYTKTADYNGIDEYPGDYFEHSLRESEKYYLKLLSLGWTAQEARAVLPNSLKTELVMTGFVSDWEHFFSLRANKAAHPDMQALAYPLLEKFKEINLITN